MRNNKLKIEISCLSIVFDVFQVLYELRVEELLKFYNSFFFCLLQLWTMYREFFKMPYNQHHIIKDIMAKTSQKNFSNDKIKKLKKFPTTNIVIV
jgi:hypothetical protein